MTHSPHLDVQGRHGSAGSHNAQRGAPRSLDIEAQDYANPDEKRVQIVEPSVEQVQNGAGDEALSPHNTLRPGSLLSRSTFKSLRRRGRMQTANLAYSTSDMGRSTGWTPGEEPGIDPSKPETDDPTATSKLHQLCEITCVDYSMDDIKIVNLDNDNLQEHLDKPKPDWAQVRWINVNGLSWDVIKILGSYKSLHPLAIEDLMNTRSRTKTDWYTDHTFVVLPLQKLVNLEEQHDSDESVTDDEEEQDVKVDDVSGDIHDETDETDIKTHFMSERERRHHEAKQKKRRRGAISSLVRDLFKTRRKKTKSRPRPGALTPSNSFRQGGKVRVPWAPRNIRTLQRYHAGPNLDRIAYFERNAVLSSRGLAVSMEQVSLFITADNTVISFFEFSAQDVESPIIRRLQSEGTILRQSNDASMLMQSIIDAIIDLAIHVTAAYQDALGDLELEVLTDPAIHESKILYILTSEIAVLRNAIAPVVQLMSALKDHKTKADITMATPSRSMTPVPSALNVSDPNPTSIFRPGMNGRNGSSYPFTKASAVTISPLTVTYLSDVEDHALLIQDSYDQMRRSADNLVDLIFNTVSAYQNDSMKQLSIVTCFFLPLSFLTGYFGMNFATFDAVTENSDGYFWYIAAPVSVVVFCLLMRDVMYRVLVKWANKLLISRARKRRLERSSTNIGRT